MFVLKLSTALGVDISLIAGPCLAALAGCIGNRRRIVLKPGTWIEPSVLWIAIILPSGGKKTPAMGAVLEHLHEREVAELEKERALLAKYDEQMREWKSAGKNMFNVQPDKPTPANRFLVSDITTEGLLAIHAKAPFGLFVHRDELGGWLRSYNQYKTGGQGGDAQTWTEMHQGRPALVDRKSSGTLSVPRAAVSMVGGIQPDLVRKCLSGEHLYDGIASRILFVAPPVTAKTWSENTIDDETLEGWNSLLDELLALQQDDDDNPIDLPMTEEAKTAWVDYYNAHAQREEKASGPYRSALSKLEAATARLALLMQVADDPQSTEVDVKAMKAGIQISEWFEDQALRVYEGIEESGMDRDRREVCDWIASKGGSTNRREFTREGPSRFRKEAGNVLDELVAAELVERRTQPGSKSDSYHLCDSDSSDNPGNS